MLNPKKAGAQFDHHPCSFSKGVFSRESLKPSFFLKFNIIRHNFPENFIDIPQVAQEDIRIFLANINYFHEFLWMFSHFLIAKKLMMLYIIDDVRMFLPLILFEP